MRLKRRKPSKHPEGTVLLICHTCEKTTKRESRVIEEPDRPAWNFRRQHAKCAEDGWGTNW